MHPRLLVLDEPTSALDPTAAEDVLATLTRLVHDLDVSVVLAEHRLERVVPFADTMVRCSTAPAGLRVGEPGRPAHDSPVAPPIVELGRAAGWVPLPLTVRDARRRARGLRDRLRPAARAGRRRRARAAGGPRARRGRRSLHGSTLAVRDVDLDPRPGTVTALMGRNGSGKSSLMWALQGGGRRRGGVVTVDGAGPRRARRRRAPHPRRTGARRTPPTCSTSRPSPRSCAAADAGRRLPPMLDRLVPGIHGDTHPRDLSEGQRLALALTLVLAGAPPVLLLDEPTRGLDYAAKRALAATLAAWRPTATPSWSPPTTSSSSPRSADHVVVLAEGEVVSSGPVRRVVAESPAFAPQVTKVLGAPWLRVDEVGGAAR